MKLHQLVEHLAEYSDTAIALTDIDIEREGGGPTILYVNQAFCKMAGYRKEEIIGGTPKMLQGKETNKLRTKALARTLGSGQMHHTMFVNYRKGGDKYHCEICAFPIENDAGETTHFIAFEREAIRKPGRPKAIQENDFWWIPAWAKSELPGGHASA